MRRVVHILTHPEDALARELIAHQQRAKECEVVVVNLTAAAPDYSRLLEEILVADSVESW